MERLLRKTVKSNTWIYVSVRGIILLPSDTDSVDEFPSRIKTVCSAHFRSRTGSHRHSVNIFIGIKGGTSNTQVL